MKKTMKTLLALVMGVAMGSSAWAVNNVSLKVGEIYPSEGWINYTYKSAQGNERWYMINSERGAGDTCDIVKGIFEDPHPQRRYLTNGAQNPNFKYEAVSAGEVTLHLWRTSPKNDLIPADAQYPYEGDTQNQWMDTTSNPTDQSYHFTVTDTPRTDGLTAGPVDSGTKLSAISTSSIQGKIVDSNGTTVQGTLAWKDGTTEVAVGENTYKVTFTPTGTLAQYFGNPTNFDVTIVGNAPWKLVENPVIVKATRVTFSDNQTKTETQYDGFLTEKGCQYAWGKDGSPTTAWTEPSDGTPCDISAKPGDATQLFMKDPAK